MEIAINYTTALASLFFVLFTLVGWRGWRIRKKNGFSLKSTYKKEFQSMDEKSHKDLLRLRIRFYIYLVLWLLLIIAAIILTIIAAKQ